MALSKLTSKPQVHTLFTQILKHSSICWLDVGMLLLVIELLQILAGFVAQLNVQSEGLQYVLM